MVGKRESWISFLLPAPMRPRQDFSVCEQVHAEKYRRIAVKLYGRDGREPETLRLDFGGGERPESGGNQPPETADHLARLCLQLPRWPISSITSILIRGIFQNVILYTNKCICRIVRSVPPK